jgi:hypothetical protein
LPRWKRLLRYFSHIITYSLPHIGNKFLTGLVHDFNYSGLCIITQQPLPAGQEILVKSSLMSSPINALIRWCGDTGNSIYKVGLEFKR